MNTSRASRNRSRSFYAGWCAWNCKMPHNDKKSEVHGFGFFCSGGYGRAHPPSTNGVTNNRIQEGIRSFMTRIRGWFRDTGMTLSGLAVCSTTRSCLSKNPLPPHRHPISLGGAQNSRGCGSQVRRFHGWFRDAGDWSTGECPCPTTNHVRL